MRGYIAFFGEGGGGVLERGRCFVWRWGKRGCFLEKERGRGGMCVLEMGRGFQLFVHEHKRCGTFL